MTGLDSAVSDLMALIFEKRETLIGIEIQRLTYDDPIFKNFNQIIINVLNFTLFASLKRDEDSAIFLAMPEEDFNILFIDTVNTGYPELLARLQSISIQDSVWEKITKISGFKREHIVPLIMRNIPTFLGIFGFLRELLSTIFGPWITIANSLVSSKFSTSCFEFISRHHGIDLKNLIEPFVDTALDFFQSMLPQDPMYLDLIQKIRDMMPIIMGFVDMLVQRMRPPPPRPQPEYQNFSFEELNSLFLGRMPPVGFMSNPSVDSGPESMSHIRRLLEGVAAEFQNAQPPAEDQE